ncbi:MAG TPA: excinuclease ATPase subunit [Candidatus Scybalocola faecigallinarum]|uniref:Excinuclease ATPase subunit n=1 Tax=Candidatus Scybalocola faecigallinarum TaxID=2840941 RepID=A0A9D1F5Q1_9FIRM|nr:excinuclease ATPase subunit [Candidatus Scybalocola faecigallinarum]
MSWGALYFYYKCPECGKLFKYATDLIPEFGDDFGKCPACNAMGTYVKEGARTKDDLLYEEVE